ncbi:MULTISPECIES: bifunctional molybdopterin-guanine dinucleotide biosynthesis adaptor protein MobB/molybdopterin molybdotransferase MoeA [Halocynthiibacter]|uniref:Molybdopterin molybdenumtransferase n=1 Tax=Halocynthiibacter halioticoli TaxID=2986804 RepID=A0AAE3J0Y7_9RHOB|nr:MULTISPECIES: bifunctional molybdopterin-guanine dinucleotide biosynthesis adaptor protein MobB/molybdopterin molybdotransferase MoeA [Halocynthiibacter]MCV6823217.1 bifunctional molybdopterin-guanine dinucleotide biosynthesis adaptor protein MobB/molybdopterin molybdotransferase MoeA [Halocynthiibacter halioticoli]MCW4056218.1 bifunctional molybdopterin-guanine dinucleotide biosynthesis adaptor protein MobB/molybdopterin molybdotransferase MoeA [Halocynthiibacter sp. SDUM655004]
MRVFGVTGWKNNGKTGLMERLIAEITRRGFTVSTTKHAHHRFDIDKEGKDSYRHRVAGAKQVLLSSSQRWALLDELRGEEEPYLAEHLSRLDPVDLVLVEGFKAARHPKIEVHRESAAREPLIALDDLTIRAVATDTAAPEGLGPDVLVFDLDDTAAIADFVLEQVGLVTKPKPDLPPLRDDCFALPDGVEWTPVETALATLRDRLKCVVRSETVPVSAACGRIAAQDILAPRDNPPTANSAVDGYGFANPTAQEAYHLTLVDGRAAAGAPYQSVVPAGHAVRILTGAALPAGVDSVVMQEDVQLVGNELRFSGPLKPRANARKAGEDVRKGSVIVAEGEEITPQAIALLSATGCDEVEVRALLRVGVLSTGDELVPAGEAASPTQTYDANRPMLLELARAWGFEPVDLGHVPDNRAALKTALDQGAESADVIFTSGGASAGDEDHVSALLSEQGTLHHWRIALKPGRPLALAMWGGVPVFGLPGNPVAAFVCALIFARPSLGVLAGAPWRSPLAFQVPADFTKKKKAGRREYLRGRLNSDGTVSAFESEGSGRISGLHWANGLIEVEEDRTQISEGELVRFLPFAGFGI